MQEKRIITDPKTAMDVLKSLVDPRSIKVITLITTEDQSPINGFHFESDLTYSAWASRNKTCYSILKNLEIPELKVFVGQGSSLEDRMKLASDFALSLIKKFSNEYIKVRAFIQPMGIPQYPPGRSGPRSFYLITTCFDNKIKKNEIIIIDNDEILPEFDADGNQLVEFSDASISNQRSMSCDEALKGISNQVKARDLVNDGARLFQEGDFDGAELKYKEALATDPQNAVARCNIGHIYFKKKQFAAAIPWLEKALVLDPSINGATECLRACKVEVNKTQSSKPISTIEIQQSQKKLWSFLVRSKWKNKNPSIRIQGIAELNPLNPAHQKKLAKIAKIDKVNDVRMAAIVRITDQNILADIAKNEKAFTVRCIAVEKIIDQNVLAHFAKNDEWVKIRYTAIEKITDHNILADVAKNAKDSTISCEVIKKLTDQNLLADIAKNATDNIGRLTAIAKLTDQKILADIAKNYIDRVILMALVEKITDQNILSDIANNASKKYYGWATVNHVTDKNIYAEGIKNVQDIVAKITDQNILIDISKNNEGIAAYAATKKLTNQGVIVDIAKNNKDRYVRCTAIEMVTDQNVLTDIAKNDKDYRVRRAAIEKITDQNVLADIAKNDKDYLVRSVAIVMITEQNYLVDVIKNAQISEARLEAAIMRVEKEYINVSIEEGQQRVFNDIYKGLGLRVAQSGFPQPKFDFEKSINAGKSADEESLTIYRTALEKLTDQNILADIAQSAKDRTARFAALEKLTDKKILADIAKNDTDNNVRTAAEKKLTDLEWATKYFEQNLVSAVDLFLEIDRGNAFRVRVIIDKGVDIKARDDKDFTALGKAAMWGYMDVVRVLLDKGADINAKVYKGLTALSMAAVQGHFDVVQLLLNRGADVNAKGDDGFTAVMLTKDSKIRALLMKAEAKI